MAKAYTAEEILASLRNLAMAPSTGALAARDEDLLVHVDEATRGYLIPRLLNLRESYFKRRSRGAVSGVLVRIEPRALFQKLEQLWFVSSGKRFRINPIPDDYVEGLTQAGAPVPDGYEIDGNDLRLHPDGGSFSGELEQVFFFRPGDLVLSTEARQVEDVDLATRTVTLASDAPSSWTDALLFDVHSKHSGAEAKVWSAAVDSLAGDTLIFSDEIDGTVFGRKAIEVGDWVCLEGEAALPGLPLELHGIAARAGAMQAAESIGDAQQVQLHAAVLEKFLGEVTKAMEVRVEAKPVRIGRGGFLTGRRRFGGRHRR